MWSVYKVKVYQRTNGFFSLLTDVFTDLSANWKVQKGCPSCLGLGDFMYAMAKVREKSRGDVLSFQRYYIMLLLALTSSTCKTVIAPPFFFFLLIFISSCCRLSVWSKDLILQTVLYKPIFVPICQVFFFYLAGKKLISICFTFGLILFCIDRKSVM